MITCSSTNCGKRVVARGMCQTHYQRAREDGEFAPRPFYAPDATCAAETCERRPKGRGLCNMHLKRVLRNGSTDLPEKAPWEPRFWSYVYPEPNTGCWLWGGSIRRKRGGYGQFSLANRKGRVAQQVAWELLVGPIPEGLQLDHLCRVPACVNPDHLEPVTQAVNIRRAVVVRERRRKERRRAAARAA